MDHALTVPVLLHFLNSVYRSKVETYEEAYSRKLKVSPSQPARSLSPHVTLLLVSYLSFQIRKNAIIYQIQIYTLIFFLFLSQVMLWISSPPWFLFFPPLIKMSWRSSCISTESFSFSCWQLQNISSMGMSESISYSLSVDRNLGYFQSLSITEWMTSSYVIWCMYVGCTRWVQVLGQKTQTFLIRTHPARPPPKGRHQSTYLWKAVGARPPAAPTLSPIRLQRGDTSAFPLWWMSLVSFYISKSHLRFSCELSVPWHCSCF